MATLNLNIRLINLKIYCKNKCSKIWMKWWPTDNSGPLVIQGRKLINYIFFKIESDTDFEADSRCIMFGEYWDSCTFLTPFFPSHTLPPQKTGWALMLCIEYLTMVGVSLILHAKTQGGHQNRANKTNCLTKMVTRKPKRTNRSSKMTTNLTPSKNAFTVSLRFPAHLPSFHAPISMV
jgi:hypothetical protein